MLVNAGSASRVGHFRYSVWARHSVQRARRGLATHAANDFRIPVIDFGRYLRSTSNKEKKETADEVVSAFKGAGFIYLSNHGIPEHVIKNAFDKVGFSYLFKPLTAYAQTK